MRNVLLVLLFVLVFPLSVVLGYFVYSRHISQSSRDSGVSDEASSEVAVQPGRSAVVPDAENARVKPQNPIDAVLEYGYELEPGQAFSEAIIYDAQVKKIETDGNLGYVEIEKNGTMARLPAVGLVAVKIASEEFNDDVLAENLGSVVETGDTIEVRLKFVGSNLNLSKEEIVRHFEEKLKGQVHYEAMMEANRLWSSQQLTETAFVSRLSENPAVFEPDELQIKSIKVLD